MRAWPWLAQCLQACYEKLDEIGGDGDEGDEEGGVLRTFTNHSGPVRSLALLPDGLHFVSGSYDKTARIVKIGPLHRTAADEAMLAAAAAEANAEDDDDEYSSSQ